MTTRRLRFLSLLSLLAGCAANSGCAATADGGGTPQPDKPPINCDGVPVDVNVEVATDGLHSCVDVCGSWDLGCVRGHSYDGSGTSTRVLDCASVPAPETDHYQCNCIKK